MTQSALSASIKEFETVLETTLVDRTKRRAVLTPVGLETVERARKIVKEVEDLEQRQMADVHSALKLLRWSTTRFMPDPISCVRNPSSAHICNMVTFSANTSPYTRRRFFSLA